MKLELPELPFTKNSLSPHMSEETLNFHHGKHHNAYVVKGNELLESADVSADNLEDLLVTLSAGVGADRVLVTTHPHPGDLLTGDGSWNGLLTHVVASVARKTGVRHFDATELLLKEGPDPIKNLYIPDDMHLNGDGLKVYARGIFNCIQQMRRPADH